MKPKTKIQKSEILDEILKEAKKRILVRNEIKEKSELADLENKINNL